jgi:two-component system, response regulator
VPSFEVIDILLVEDSDADAELTMRALRKGRVMNEVLRVQDGAEALEFILREGDYAERPGGLPNLILLDLNMPKVGGIEVIQRLKSEPLTKSIPIVVLTASAQAQDIIEGYNLGINGYLVKPISVAAFNEVVIQVGLFWSVTNRVPG